MKKPYGIAVAAALAIGGMTVIGCQNKDKDRDNPPASTAGGMTGGGSTDSYGTSSNARYKSTGNIGVDTGSTPSNNGVARPPAPVQSGNTGGTNNPPQTPSGPGGSTGAAGTGTYAPGGGTFQGTSSGTEAGAGVRTNERPTPNTNGNQNANGTAGNAVGGTNGNGTSYNNGQAGNPNR